MRKIIHVDMDYFFAQVEERDKPQLKTKPVAIGGMRNGRGVLCTSNYIARKFGVKSAMPTAWALKLCPSLVLIPPTFSKYSEASAEVFKIFYEFSDLVQPLSLDEAFIDVSDCELFDNDAVKIAKEIKKRIFERTKLTASAGVSYNKFLAKIGSDLFKPNGLAILRAENIEKNIAHFSISKMLGVGKVTKLKMEKLDIRSFKDLQMHTKLDLINMFGDYGVNLFNYCRGIDDRPVRANRQRKSLSVERTFNENMDQCSDLHLKLEECFEEMLRRLEKHKHRFIKTIFVKIKNSDFSQTTIEVSAKIEFSEFKKIFQKRFSELENKEIRLLGTGVRFGEKSSLGQLELPISA